MVYIILTFLLKMEQMFDERENDNYKDTLNITADPQMTKLCIFPAEVKPKMSKQKPKFTFILGRYVIKSLLVLLMSNPVIKCQTDLFGLPLHSFIKHV